MMRTGWWCGLLLAAVSVAAPVAELAQRIAELGHEKFAVREAAEQQLLKLATSNHPPVLAECVRVYRQTTDPEVRVRLMHVMEAIVDQHLFRAPRGFLGVQLQNVFIGAGGALVINGQTIPPGAAWVSRVLDDTGAQKAGVQANDFIIGVDTQKWETGSSGFTEYVQAKRPGEHLKLVIVRGTETNKIDAMLGELPEAEQERVYAEDRRQAFFEKWCEQNLTSPAPGKTEVSRPTQ